MNASSFSNSLIFKNPSSIEGCGIVQFFKEDYPQVFCAINISKSPLGQLKECVTFALREDNSQPLLYGFSNRPDARSARFNTNVALLPSDVRANRRVNVQKEMCMLFTADTFSPRSRFEIVAGRHRLPFPLLLSQAAQEGLSGYCLGRFGVNGQFSGTYHRAHILSESFDCGFLGNSLELNSREKSLLEAFSIPFISLACDTYIIDHFSGIMPAPNGKQEFFELRNKKVASSYACDF